MKIRIVCADQSIHTCSTSFRSAVYLASVLVGDSRAKAFHVSVERVEPGFVDWYCVWYKDTDKVTFVKGLPQYLAKFSRDVVDNFVQQQSWESLPF